MTKTVDAERRVAALLLSVSCLLAAAPARAQSGVQYAYDDLGRLIAVIDSSGSAAGYQYDAVGNILAITRYTSAQTSVLGFSPARGPVGTRVTVTGTGFSATAGQNTVRFNGTTASIVSATVNQLVVTVPAAATSGTIAVTSPSGSASSSSAFTVTASTAAPTVTSFSPPNGLPGTNLSITGTNFDPLLANNKPKLNASPLAPATTTTTQISTVVAPRTASGRVSVATPAGQATSSQDFYVPFGTHATGDIGFTGRVSSGGSQAVSLAAGKIGLVLFDATQGQIATVHFTGNTISSCTAYLLSPANTQLATGTCPSFLAPSYLAQSGTYTVGIEAGTAGSITVSLTATPAATAPPSRPTTSVIDYSNVLSSGLVGLFLANEGTGSTDKNLADLQTASFSGTALPSWNTADPSIVIAGGAALNSYLSAGTDSNLDRLTTTKTTIVAKLYVNPVSGGITAAGVCERNDGNTIDSGFVFGWDSTGALKLTVERSTQNMRVASTAGLVSTGQWIQVAFTWDGTIATAAAAHLFLNGIEQPKASSGDGAGTVGYKNASSNPFRIGTAGFDVTGSLNGKLAYLAVYRGRILTSGEMAQLDTLLPTNTSDIVAPITPNGAPVVVTTTALGQSAQLTFNGNVEQQAQVQLSSNTLGSVTVSLLASDGTTICSQQSSASSFSVPAGSLFAAALYRIYVHPATPVTGSITVSLATSGGVGTIPPRPAGATLDTGNSLSNSLVGLFVMNEGTGTTDKNLVSLQTASFSGGSLPTWNTSDPSVVFGGGASLNSYLNAGTDLTFDRLTPSQMTLVAKVYVSTLAAAGVCEKNDGNTIDSGFVFGWDGTGALRLTVERSSTDMRVATAASAVPSGQWTQFAVTWDGTSPAASSAHLFVNGNEQAKASAADGSGTVGYTNATNKPFRVGNASFDFAGSLNGRMAYLAVYRGRILTPSEMSQLDSQLPIH